MLVFPFGMAGTRRFEVIIGAQTDLNLKTYLTNNTDWNGTDEGVTFDVTLAGKIQASSTSWPALQIDAMPARTVLTITQNAEVTGRGGAAASAGGTAINSDPQLSDVTISWTNNSEINGGGGGGGNGASGSGRGQVIDINCLCVGALCPGGSGGSGYGPNAASSGNSGTTVSADLDCSLSVGDCIGGTGGDGGDKGTAGSTGGGGSECNVVISGTAGGAAGAAVTGDSNVNWLTLGTINGARS